MLGGKGFDRVINLKGGFLAWEGAKAFWGEEKGLELFSGMTSHEQTFFVAYAMEAGLGEFYLSIAQEVENDAVQKTFQHLSQIEEKHQERIYRQYILLSGAAITREDFVSRWVVPAVEGGLTTEEYIDIFNPDRKSVQGVIELAMSIEAQALDLYSRASERTDHKGSKVFLSQIADEEQNHLTQLGQLMDSVVGQGV